MNKKTTVWTSIGIIMLLLTVTAGLAQIADIIPGIDGLFQKELPVDDADVKALTDKGLDDFIVDTTTCSTTSCQTVLYRTITTTYFTNDWNGTEVVPVEHSVTNKQVIQPLSWQIEPDMTDITLDQARTDAISLYLKQAAQPSNGIGPTKDETTIQLPAQHITIGTTGGKEPPVKDGGGLQV